MINHEVELIVLKLLGYLIGVRPLDIEGSRLIVYSRSQYCLSRFVAHSSRQEQSTQHGY